MLTDRKNYSTKNTEVSENNYSGTFFLQNSESGWEKIDGYIFHNAEITLMKSDFKTCSEKFNYICSWMDKNLKGSYTHTGTYYPDTFIFKFQFKSDMEKTIKYFK